MGFGCPDFCRGTRLLFGRGGDGFRETPWERPSARPSKVEHTTAVYSGLLRMADLLALQPNMRTKLHIVAPGERRNKASREIKRPVFSLLERRPLYKECTYLPYDAVWTIADIEFLAHMSDTILDEHEEGAVDG